MDDHPEDSLICYARAVETPAALGRSPAVSTEVDRSYGRSSTAALPG
ncbi:hypothetical protein AB0B85_33105 [Micromonospora sp. NPDC049044]